MANPNKTVARFRERLGFPARELRPDQIEFGKRAGIAAEKLANKEWTESQCQHYLNTGKIP